MIRVVSKVLSVRNRLEKLVWQFRQPLAKKPSDPRSTVSDLFVWRKGRGWQTFFELTDVASLFGQFSESGMVRVLIFDQSGSFAGESSFEVPSNSRKRINVSELAASCQDKIGTFCVLHHKTPDIICDLGSHIAERGYVSYCYGKSCFRTYVHGNLDAVSLTPKGAIEFLAGTSFLQREYRLQHELKKDKLYDVAVVNASAKTQLVRLELFETTAEARPPEFFATMMHLAPVSRYHQSEIDLKPGACHLFQINANECPGNSVRVVIKSHLVMLRPVVFDTGKYQIDAFHG